MPREWRESVIAARRGKEGEEKKLEDARTSIARLVEVQSDDVIFTSGATEANALAYSRTDEKGRPHVVPSVRSCVDC